MKRKILIITALLSLSACGTTNNSSTSIDGTSKDELSSITSSDITSSTSSNIPSSSSIPTSSTETNDSSINQTSSDSTSSIDINKVIEIDNINEIYTMGSKLNVDEIGELVKFSATYLNTLTWSNSNEDIMILADDSASIGLHVPYSSYSGYLANRYTQCDYVITANIKNTLGQIELVLNSSLDVKDSFVNSSSTTPSVDLSKTSEHKNDISEIIKEFEAIPLNNKKFGYGKIVSVDAQLIAVEYEDSGKKAVFFDGTHCITTVCDKKIADKADIGKSYTITGVMSVSRTSPALWFLNKTYITPENEQTTIDVSKAIEKTASSFKDKYIVGDEENWKIPTYEEYMSLYKTTGYINDDTSRTSAYYVGMVDKLNGSLSDTGIKTSIPGFFLKNHQNLSENDFTYSPFYNYYIQESQITIYYSIHSFSSQNHAWEVFAIESLIN